MGMITSSNKILMALVIFLSTFFTLIELRQNVQSSIFKKRAKRRNNLEHTMDFKIVGGEDASVKEYPFVVSLQVRCNHVCGGSIITGLFILTAAHCVVSTKKNNSWSIKDPLDYNIVAGQTVLDLGECQFRDVKEIYVHSGYNVSIQENDIALLEIFDPLEWTNYTKTVELFSGQHLSYESHDFCTVIGWGTREAYVEVSQNETRKLPQNNNLQQVDLPPSSSNTCENYFKVNKAPHLFDKTKLCVILTGGKDACKGDSGGPFICNGIQYGIVSFGIGCAQPNMPALFTNVSAFHEWIFGVINNTEVLVVSRTVEVLNITRVSPLQDGRMIQSRSINAQSNLKYSRLLEEIMIFIILIFSLTYD